MVKIRLDMGYSFSDKMFKYRLKVTVGWDWGEVGIQILLKYWLMVTDGWGRGENRHLVNPNVQEGKCQCAEIEFLFD